MSTYIASLAAGHFTLVIILITIFAGALAAGLAGFAFSAITGAVLFHLLAPIEAVPLLLACSITTQVFSISKLWRTMQWSQCFPYLLGGFAGIPIGAQLLKAVDPHAFSSGFGLFLICYSLYMLLRPHTPSFAVADATPKLPPALRAASRAAQRPFRAPFPPSGAAFRAFQSWSSGESSSLLFCSCRSQPSFIFPSSAFSPRER